MRDLSDMSDEKIREAVEAIQELWPTALADHKAFLETTSRRLNVAQKQREAYLRGVLHGVVLAVREIEKRAPMHFYGSKG